MGHPTGSPKLHTQMTAKRRDKLKALGASIPLPEISGDSAGEVLLITWGSTYGQAREAVQRVGTFGVKAGHLHLRHLNPLPNGLEQVFARYEKIVVAEINDEGLYGYGQLAMLLRARYANPKIVSVTKTDGLTFKVSEITGGIAKFVQNEALTASVTIARPSALAKTS
jgi:2-oxoglutarate ferredoxin oxidoreductase subunit alpha